MNKRERLLVCMTALLLIGIVAFGVFGFWLPYRQAVRTFPEGTQIALQQQADGSVEISWYPAENATKYLLEILIPNAYGDPKVEQEYWVEGQTACIVKDLNAESLRTIRIRAVGEYQIPLSKTPRIRLSEDTLSATDIFCAPEVTDISWYADPDADTVQVSATQINDGILRLYDASQGKLDELVEVLHDGNTVLSFGNDGKWPIPAHGQQYAFVFDAFRQEKDYVFYSKKSKAIVLNREDFLGTQLYLNVEEKNNRYNITWNETKGEYYQLQHRMAGTDTWETLTQVPADGELAYTASGLQAYSSHEYRVIACNKGTEQEVLIAESEALMVRTKSQVLFSTIWPISELPVYADAKATQKLGVAQAGQTFCVLDMDDEMFRIRYNHEIGYIDSNYCMINLAEFLGNLCSYDIANSYSAIYKIHEFDIPEITGTVIVGYENIIVGQDEYMVPLMYPTALKLEQAAVAAAQKGYKFKIYDAFRPQAATYDLYDRTSVFVEEAIPEESIPEEYLTEESQPASSTNSENEDTLTYADFMTNNGKYSLSHFLAKGRSRHNQGVALDMTVMDATDELQMQTAMHDLSWYSATDQNNDLANTLAELIKPFGFNGLSSEWWHFQDDDTLNALKLPTLFDGVSPECWKADENGWRYRCADGSYYTNCTKTIDGETYEFDADGYLIYN